MVGVKCGWARVSVGGLRGAKDKRCVSQKDAFYHVRSQIAPLMNLL